jgi:hypothetical protein
MRMTASIPVRSVRTAWCGPVAAALLLACGGCLGEPPIDERWTLLEFESATPALGAAVAADSTLTVSVRGRITYREIQTGFLVAELRYSDTLAPADVPLDPEVHSLEHALAVERILANSVTAGRATRAVTGFDHLIQAIDLRFTAPVPAGLGTAAGDSAATRGLFLVLYLGEGDLQELPAGGDSLVVTPFDVEASRTLFCGYPLPVAAAPAGARP